MKSSNTKLKKYASVLNDAAPEGEFLAYINKDEAQLLRDNGGLGLLTDFGIPSYRGAGGYQGGSPGNTGGSRSSSGGGGRSSGGGGGGGRDSGGGGGGGRDYSPPTVSAPVVSTPPVAPPSISQAPIEVGIPDRDSGFVDVIGTIPAAPDIFDINVLGDPALRDINIPSLTPREQSIISQYERTPQALGMVDAEDEYLAPDPQHFNKTQREINKKINEAKQEGNYDVKLTKEQYEQFNKDLNEYYGTEDVKYEPYGRAGKGTVNLTFGEHWQNLGMQYPASKFSPFGRFLGALGRNVSEYLTSDYGTGRYGGSGTMGSSYAVDRGGLLGRLGITPGTGGQGVITDTGGDTTTITAEPTPITPTTTLPPSMVNQYFANLGSMGNGLSSSLQTDYNNAKNSINSILGIIPPSQQFGYSADPYGGLMASNVTTNPFNIDYLRRLGLI